MVGVNVGMLSACESPFGGVKGSGFGREGGTQVCSNRYFVVRKMCVLIDVYRELTNILRSRACSLMWPIDWRKAGNYEI